MRLVEPSDARLALINSLARGRNQKLANAVGALRKARRKTKTTRRQSPQLDPDSVDYNRPPVGWRAFMKDHVFWAEGTVGCSDSWLPRRQVLGIRDSSPTPSLIDDLSECSSCCDSDSLSDLNLMTPPLLLLPEPEPEPVLVKEEEDKLFDMYINMDLCAP
ncbi:hypothetical protein BDM02DRAFT_3189115 [Thelephora ganbajun]|uniref:Uncharacterized protein n=1 Tax=Thelephora ganbajun TaxID=370292 RepID=A0ACB6Z925_THEGA|nr:hypothetical protein BDM02DRAFT_3189115 [Thelephora ganbajun]